MQLNTADVKQFFIDGRVSHYLTYELAFDIERKRSLRSLNFFILPSATRPKDNGKMRKESLCHSSNFSQISMDVPFPFSFRIESKSLFRLFPKGSSLFCACGYKCHCMTGRRRKNAVPRPFEGAVFHLTFE